MDSHTKKLSVFQGIGLLFLLLALPVGIYVYQTQNVGETRSQAGTTCPVCPAGMTAFMGSMRDGVRSCGCKPIPGYIAPAEGIGGPAVTTPTPTKTIAERCNADCASNADCGGEDMVCTQVEGKGKCRNALCYGTSDCWCYKVETTPTSANFCNRSCTSNADCGTSMICVKTADGNKCREPQCFGESSCICYTTLTTPTPTERQLAVVPTRRLTATPIPTEGLTATPTPTINLLALVSLPSPPPTSEVKEPEMFIDPFYNSKKQANPQLALSGTTEPYASITISISPDAISGSVAADRLGNWTWTSPKALKNGQKQLTVRVATDQGGESVKTETFTVVGGVQFPTSAIVFILLIALGIGGYVVFQLKKNQTPPPEFPETPPSQPITPEETPVVSVSSAPPQPEPTSPEPLSSSQASVPTEPLTSQGSEPPKS